MTGLGVEAGDLAKRRDTDAPSLRRQLEGDLDWILLKAMDKDPARRYASASELAADIERHLSDEPVLARPPAALYRLGKAVRKHRLAAASAAAVVVALSAGLVVSVSMYLRASDARLEAEAQRAVANEQSYRANIGAAELLLRDNQSTEAQKTLAAAPESLRGWEWNFLWRRTIENFGIVAADQGAVNFAEFADDGTGVIWVTEQGKLQQSPLPSDGPASPSRRPDTLAGEGAAVVAVNHDGSAYVSTRWSLPLAGATIHAIRPPGPYVLVAERGQDAVEDRTLQVVDTESSSVRARMLLPSIGRSAPLALHKNRATLASPRGIVLLDGSTILATSGYEGSVVSATFSADGRRVATWTWDNVVRVWDALTGRPIAAFTGHTDGISQAAFSPDSSRLASASHDGTVRVWALASATGNLALTGHAGGATAVAWSRDGTQLVSGGADNALRVWTRTGALAAVLFGHTAAITAVTFSLDDKSVLSGSFDRTIRCWDTTTRRPVATLAGHLGEVRTIAVSPDGRRVVSGSSDGTVRVWRMPAFHPLNSGDGSVSASADSGRVASIGRDGIARVWEVGRPEALLADTMSGGAAPAISADGRMFAATFDHTLHVWDIDRRKLVVLRGLAAGIQAVAVSANGTRVASSGGNERIRIWDLASSDPPTAIDGVRDVHLLALQPRR